jgi:hypothetical protein
MRSHVDLPNDQKWLDLRMKTLGYVSDIGVCFGIAYMGMQAILSMDINTFDQRLKEINAIPISEFANKMASIREQQKNAKEKIDNSLTEISAFFDGVELAHHAGLYPYLFEDKVRSQKIERSLTSLVVSKKLEAEGGLAEIDSFSGIYTQENLITYFEELKKTIEITNHPPQPIVLMLTSVNHTITIGFDPNSKRWMLIDANHLPTKYFSETRDIVTQVIASLNADRLSNGMTIFLTQVWGTKSNTDLLKEYIHTWKEQESWQSLHTVTCEKSKN